MSVHIRRIGEGSRWITGCELRIAGLRVAGRKGYIEEFGSRNKVNPMEPGNKLIEKSIFQTLYALSPYPLPYAPSFRIPPSHFRLQSSVLCPFLDIDLDALMG